VTPAGTARVSANNASLVIGRQIRDKAGTLLYVIQR
jgi:hypothetical protein